jgi:hypothetical protein
MVVAMGQIIGLMIENKHWIQNAVMFSKEVRKFCYWCMDEKILRYYKSLSITVSVIQIKGKEVGSKAV